MSDSLQSHGYDLIAFQTPLSMEFSMQEYWSGLPCLPPGDLPEPGIEPGSPALIGRLFTAKRPGKPSTLGYHFLMCDINSRGVREADLERSGLRNAYCVKSLLLLCRAVLTSVLLSSLLCVCVGVCVCLVAESCLTILGPHNCSVSGPSIHGIFQVRILEWVAISFSRWSSSSSQYVCQSPGWLPYLHQWLILHL